VPVLKRAVTCIGVLAGVGFIRELIGWVYHYKFPTMVRASPASTHIHLLFTYDTLSIVR
jgi:hypothetical protein